MSAVDFNYAGTRELSLMAFGGADPTGHTSSAAALTAAITSANAKRPCVIKIPLGRYKIDAYCGSLLAGVSIVGEYAGPSIGVPDGFGGVAYGYVGTTILLPDGPNRMQPWVRFRRGTAFLNLNFVQPDQTVAGITTGWIDGDPANGYFVDGDPVAYAPIFVPDMTHNDDGAAAHVNGGRVVFRNIGLLGVYDGFHLRDDAVVNQAAVADIDIQGVRGWCIHDSFVFSQLSVMSTMSDVRLTPAFYSPAGQDIGDLSDPLNPASARINPQRLARWAKRNATVVKLTNRAVGMRISDLRARTANCVYWIIGGYRGEGDPYRGLRSGRVNQGEFEWGGEQIPTVLRIDRDGYTHETRWKVGGHAVDDEDPTCVAPVFDLGAVDRDIAGNLSHAVDEGGGRIFKLQGSVVGWRFEIDSSIRESSGPFLVSGLKDGHSLVKITGNAARLCQGDPTRSWFEIAAGSRLMIKMGLFECYPSANGSRNIFDVPDALHLRCIGADFFGVARLTNLPGLDLRNTDVFAACRIDQRGFTALAEPDVEGAVNIVALAIPARPADADTGAPPVAASSGAVVQSSGGDVDDDTVVTGGPSAGAAFADKYD